MENISYNVYLPSEEVSVGGELAPTAADPIDEGGEPTAALVETNNEQEGMKTSLAVNAAINLGKTAVSQVIGNIGIATGDYVTQSRIQDTINAATSLFGFVASLSNPFTAAVGIGSMVISTAGTIYAQVKKLQTENYTAEQNARRYGGFYSVDNRNY